MNAYAKLLRDHPLFSSLSARSLNRLTTHAALVEYPKGNIVVKEGDRCDAFYVVLSGRCQAAILLPDGSEQILDIYAPGDTFGERALLSKDHFWTTVKVITDSVLLRIDSADVLPLIEKSPRLEKALEYQMHNQMRNFRKDRELEKLGRVVTFASISENSQGRVIAHNTAVAVRKETGRSVLYVEFVKGEGSPALSDWEHVKENYFDDLRSAGDARKGENGVWELRIRVGGSEHEAEYIAPLMGHLAKHARYVIIHCASRVPGHLVSQFLIQADLPYNLLRQSPDDVYRSHMLVRQVHSYPGGEMVQMLPLVCLEYDERSLPYETLEKQVGVPIHGFIHELPKSAKETHDHYQHHTGGRFSAHIRHLAREIGRNRIGLALSAGGAKGLAHIGVIQVLEANNIDVDVVAGTSMGGLVGALWSHGLNGQEMEEIAKSLRGPFHSIKLFDPVFPPRRGFIRGRRIQTVVREAIGRAHFSDMTRELRIVATDLDTLERITIQSGEVAPVIHASMAMPGVVVPVTLNGRTFVDGGVADPLPVDVLIEMGVEHIIAVNTIPNPEELKSCMRISTEAIPRKKRKNKLYRIVNRYINYFAQGNILDIWMKSMHGAETRVAEGACKQADVVLRPVACDGKWHDFANADKYIELGRQAAEDQIEELLTLVK